MSNASRTTNSIRNSSVMIMCKVLSLIFSFIVRTIFIKKLGVEILGIEGLFSSIITILNLADLGISTAIIFLLYKPLAENNVDKISAIMRYFSRFYTIVGIAVLIIGLAITPLVPYVVKLENPIENLYLYYILTIILTGSSYFFASSRCLFEANQNGYIVTIVDTIISILSSSTRLIILLLTRNYTYYIVTNITFTIAANLIIRTLARLKYKDLIEKSDSMLTKEDKKEIGKNMRAVMAHKVGTVLVTGTDNLLISMLISTIVVGIYSNYLLIINTILMLVTVTINSLTPSVGNLKATSTDPEKDYQVFKKINFVSFWIITVTAICMFVLFNQFITIWVGTDYLFGIGIVLLLCANYYISAMRYGIGVFATAAGYFKETWFKPFLEGIVNLVVSIILAKYIGVAGIFLGTTASLILGSVWIDPVVTYKKWFKRNPWDYFATYLIRMIIFATCGTGAYFLTNLIHINGGILEWIIKAAVCFMFVNICLLLIYCRTKTFKELYNKFINLLKK